MDDLMLHTLYSGMHSEICSAKNYLLYRRSYSHGDDNAHNSGNYEPLDSSELIDFPLPPLDVIME